MYVQEAIREFRRLKSLAEAAIAQVDDAAFMTALTADDNSIAIIVKHLAGNMRSRFREFLTTDGEKPDRDRASEFVLAADDTRESLLSAWEQGWQVLFDAISSLTDDHLDRAVTIRGEPLTVLQAVQRQLTHYAYHVGQLVFLAKHHAGSAWANLSIPQGRSLEFSMHPTRYLK